MGSPYTNDFSAQLRRDPCPFGQALEDLVGLLNADRPGDAELLHGLAAVRSARFALWRSAVPEINDALGALVFINSRWQNKRISANNTRLLDVGRSDKINAVIEALLSDA